MERKRIIQLACEVGFCNLRNEHWDCHTEQIEAFAKLVAAHEREAAIDAVLQVIEELRPALALAAFADRDKAWALDKVKESVERLKE